MYYCSVCKVGEHLKGRYIQSCSENSDSVNEGTSYANCRDETNCLSCLILMASIQQLVWVSQQRQQLYSTSNPTDPFRARVRFSPWEEEIIFYTSLFLVVFCSLSVLCLFCIAGRFVATIQEAMKKLTSAKLGSHSQEHIFLEEFMEWEF